VKINNLDTCCEQVEEGRAAKQMFVALFYCTVFKTSSPLSAELITDNFRLAGLRKWDKEEAKNPTL
jgi:hypothetical protein